MSVERESPFTENPYAFPEFNRFFILAFKDGAIRRMNWPQMLSPDDIERKWRVFTYYYFTPLSLAEVGEKEIGKDRLTRQGVHRINKDLIYRLYDALSPEIKSSLPDLKEIPLNKPTTLLGTKYVNRRISVGHGGLSLTVEKGLAAGQTLSQIEEGNNLTAAQIRGARSILTGWEVKVPFKITPAMKNRQMVDELKDPNKPDSQKEPLWEKVGYRVLERLLAEGVVISMQDLLTEAGYHVKTNLYSKFSEVLGSKGVRVRTFQRQVMVEDGKVMTLRYLYLKTEEIDRAKQILNQEESLKVYKRNPVSKISGPEDTPIPTTNDLIHGQVYDSVGWLIYEESKVKMGNNWRIEDIIEPECSIPIFKMRVTRKFSPRGFSNRYFCLKSRKEELVRYLRSRARYIKLAVKDS